MPGRYSGKIRAKRIELHYFKRLHPFRRWKLILTLAIPAVAAVWLLVMAARGDQRIYNSGPLSTAHAMFNVQCVQCHVPARAEAGRTAPAGNGFWVKVSDRACLKCHDGAIHHDAQMFDPGCVNCHVEHKGHVDLAAMSDLHCTRCHGDLKTKAGTHTTYEPKIGRFPRQHPEFAVSVKDGDRTLRVRLDDKAHLTDTAQVCLDHQKHLKPALFRPDAPWYRPGMRGVLDTPKGLQLNCTFCHEPDGQRAYMTPISYAKHCGMCHPLEFDRRRFPGAVAPHDKPGLVHAFLRTRYAEAPEGQPAPAEARAAPKKAEEEDNQPRRRLGPRDDATEEEQPRARLGGQRNEPEEQPQAKGREDVESSLFFRDKEKQIANPCLLCHTMIAPGKPDVAARCSETNRQERRAVDQAVEAVRAALKDDRGIKLPDVAATGIPQRWLPHSHFDHGAHRSLACTECHTATRSTETKDVLLPSITTCRECHRGLAGARSGCVECHLYHDPVRTRDLNGPLTIQQFVTGAPPARPASTTTAGAPKLQ
jgi:hypothetical protein